MSPSEAVSATRERPEPKADCAAAYDLSPRARALLRGVEIAHQDLRDSGGAYDLDQVRALLHGVTRQRIDKRIEEGSLLAVPGPSNVRRYPVAQFMDDGSIVPGLREVLTALPTKSGFAALNFLIRPDDRLDGRKPIDLLKKGEIDRVVAAARAYGLAGS